MSQDMSMEEREAWEGIDRAHQQAKAEGRGDEFMVEVERYAFHVLQVKCIERKCNAEFCEISLDYYDAKELGQEAEFAQKHGLSPDLVQFLEDEIAFGIACGDFIELQETGKKEGTLEEYLRGRGFDDFDIERAKEDCAVEEELRAISRDCKEFSLYKT